MNGPEDTIRAALRETAADVSAHRVPPLRLPASRRGTTGAFRRLRSRRLAGWLLPLTAAAAAMGVVVAAETAGSGLPAGQLRPASGAAGPVVPPHYVVVPGNQRQLGPPGTALLRQTATGGLLAMIRPPGGGMFTAVAGTGNGRTFVLAERARASGGPAGPAGRVLRFFRLSVGANGRVRRLAALPAQVREPGAVLTGLALSPDGSRLALSVMLAGRPQIEVISLASGRARTWSGAVPARHQAAPPGGTWVMKLSWAADDRTLAYNDDYSSGYRVLDEVRLLDTAAPGTLLPLAGPGSAGAASAGRQASLVCSAPGLRPPIPGQVGMITADGGQIIGIGSYLPHSEVIAGIPRSLWDAFAYPCPAAGLRAVRARVRLIRWGRHTGFPQWIYWVSPGGRALIAVVNFGLGGRGVVGVLRGSRFTALPGSSSIPVVPAPPDAPAAW